MSRNKENNPLFTATTAQRHGRLPSLGKQPPSDDFFTDSLIADDSLIPSPSPQKISSGAKPRRALGAGRALQHTKDWGNKSKRSSLAEYTAARSARRLQPSPTLTRKKSPEPNSRQPADPSTPPQSSHGLGVASPTAEEYSSPPAGMTDVYQRIADEEDLAATERELDTDEDELENGPQDTLESDVDLGAHSKHDAVEAENSNQQRRSQETTPVPAESDAGTQNGLDDGLESNSAPPTLDFAQAQMTDRAIATKLTPHAFDRAKDRARLDKLRQSRIPLDFTHSPKGQNSTPMTNGRRHDIASVANRGPITFNNPISDKVNAFPKAYSDTSAESTPQKRIKAFSRATKAGAHKRVPPQDDGSDTPPELRERERVVAFSKANRRKPTQDTEPELPAAPAPRLVAFSRANGQPRPYGAPYEPNGNERHGNGDITGSASSAASEPVPGLIPSVDGSIKPVTLSFLGKWRHKTAERRAAKQSETVDENESQVDWAAAAADVPLPSVEQSIEQSSTPRDTPPKPMSPYHHSSVDRVRKWENDFTGLSFQVSESPPVRSRPPPSDSWKEKEIEDLARQAVTTNRLDEIQVKDPSVRVRKSSSSLSPVDRRKTEAQIPDTPGEGELEPTNKPGQTEGPMPDTPVLVNRQPSGNTERSKSSHRSASQSHSSLDHLQRLARAASTTPRSSSVLEEPIQQNRVQSAAEAEEGDTIPDAGMDTREQSPQREPAENQRASSKPVAETPKVVGAWTDTILPETVKTQKRTASRVSKYMETPHVNAGAWIDTPLANGDRMQSQSFPNTIEEVTEDLTKDIISAAAEVGSVDEDSELPNKRSEQEHNEQDKSEGKTPDPQTQASANVAVFMPPSALTNVLNEAKRKRLVSRDITDRDDTLNLGDATIASFEDLLTDAADITADLTSLIKTGAEDEMLQQRKMEQAEDSTSAEVAFIGHLTSRMQRLMTNLHEARKGISRLEQRVSHSPAPDLSQQGSGEQQQCTVCKEGSGGHYHHHPLIEYNGTEYYSNSLFPISYSTFTIPIPLLFYPRNKNRNSSSRVSAIFSPLPRPTWLGWLTIAIWTWYLTECTLCEIYCHPLYAERYVWPAQPEPEFPFVLPTMLWRWTFGTNQLGGGVGVASAVALPLQLVLYLVTSIWRLVVAVYRVVGMALGLIDGFVDDEGHGIGSGGAATHVSLAQRATNSLLWNAAARTMGAGEAQASQDLSMMNDDFI
ncbi:hypothetical protein ABEF95_005564 [Exophiala dermatitidis]